MTKLAADYLNRAQIARRVKARAIDAQRKVWSAGRAGAGSTRAKTMPDRARPTGRRPQLAPAA
ncbi:MAG: hypothetical protein HOM58_10500 [Rhodospirillaceae bacterium]|mgnify:CR=1|jgi:hypothetical protein|nr:hypothetical protein [Rhodospirillaceae bacterium]MBT5459816.1 hypothetical protein [Rhodospirillaceae bacterium]